ncbi:MAG: methionine--tRNA ligase [Thermodesulfobacteria bacterium]|nr:methionine--tRNA ligase [Thermodesulfobacteriota bacterium]
MKIYLTTPIYYVNALPHLGHAYTTIVVDSLARFYRLKGKEVFFLTGTDEHGDKIQKSAKEKGIPPEKFVDEISAKFKSCWDFFKISYNYFIRTTSEKHKKVVQKVLQDLYEKGEIYLDEYEGLYCYGCERFLTPKELDESGCCRDHKCKPEKIKEKNYFFNLEKYRGWLKDYIYKNDVIYPEFYKEEVLNMLEEELPPLCISRPKKRLTWGIELPFDKDYVTYVWFDALLNYLSAIGYPEDPNWKDWWNVVHHTIAKDILKPHAIYWPIMLKAMGLPVYKKLYVHGYWLVDKLKMSKSIGNIVDPIELATEFGRDQLRYFLLREMAFGYDGEFSLEALINRINADLANDYGNLIYRTMNLVEKFFDSKVPEMYTPEREDTEFLTLVAGKIREFEQEFEKMQFHRALESLWEGIRAGNVYIDKKAPWSLVKSGKKEEAGGVLRILLEAIKNFAIVLSCVMPETSEELLKRLGYQGEVSFSKAFDFEGLTTGSKVEKGSPLFPRIDVKKLEEKKKAEKDIQENLITIEEFGKVELRIGKVVFAEKVKGADRLLRLEVECPEKRQIVSGIAEFYSPEELIGKEVVVVTNLKPAKIRGVKSEGMLLAAKDKNGLTLIIPEKEVTPGAKVR